MNLCPDKGTEQGFLDKPCCEVPDMRFDTLYRLNGGTLGWGPRDAGFDSRALYLTFVFRRSI